MSNNKITFLGASSSGRSYEYSVADDAAKQLLESNGVNFSVAPGRELSFYSSTNCYLFGNEIGRTLEVNVKGYEPSPGRTVNYFNGVDKAKQKAFVQSIKDNATLTRMSVAVEAGHDSLALHKADVLMAELALMKEKLAKMQSAEL